MKLTLTGNVTSSSIEVLGGKSYIANSVNGPSTFVAIRSSDYDGATVKVQFAPENTASLYEDVVDGSWTANAQTFLDVKNGWIRFVVTGGGGAQEIEVWVS